MSNEAIAEIIELRIYLNLSVFQIAKQTGIKVDDVYKALGKYTSKPAEDLTFTSKVNLDNRSWFIFTNREFMTNKEIANELGISVPHVRRLAIEFQRKHYIRTYENTPYSRETNVTLNMETGIFYKSVNEAAKSISHYSQVHAHNMILGRKKNRTAFRVV